MLIHDSGEKTSSIQFFSLLAMVRLLKKFTL